MAKLKSQRKSSTVTAAEENARLARHGLSLPRALLQALERSGVYCFPGISVEHQHLSGRFVLKGTESGGAIDSMGRYCGFLDRDGQALPWLQPLDSFGGNGRHAIVIAPELVRVEMVRIERTYDLLISRHVLAKPDGEKRPHLKSTILFRGRTGTMAPELLSGDPPQGAGSTTPVFHTAAGELHAHPSRFDEAIRSITIAVGCVRCKHTHIAVRPSPLSGNSNR